jgi:hypothetical protein
VWKMPANLRRIIKPKYVPFVIVSITDRLLPIVGSIDKSLKINIINHYVRLLI